MPYPSFSQKPEVLLFSLEPEEGKPYSNFTVLAYSLALEKAGCNVKMLSIARNGTLKMVKAGGDEYLTNQEAAFRLPDMADTDNPLMGLLSEQIEHYKNNPSPNFSIETREDGEYIHFKEWKQNIKDFDGAVGWNAFKAQLGELKEKRPDICFLNDPDAIKTVTGKIACQEVFESEGVSVPVTLSLEKDEPYDPEAIQQKMSDYGITLPCIIKTEYGRAGTGVYNPSTMEEALAVIQKLKEDGQGMLVQEMINPEAAPEWIRVYVADGEVVDTLKCTGKADALPRVVDKLIYPYQDIANTRLHGPKVPCIASSAVKDVAVAAHNASGLRVSGSDVLVRPDGTAAVVDIGDCPDSQPHLLNGRNVIATSVRGFVEELHERVKGNIIRKNMYQENNPKRIIQLLGYPGVGKETIARVLCEATGMALRHSEGYNAEAFRKHGIGNMKDPTPEALQEAAEARQQDFKRLNALPAAEFPNLVFTNKFCEGNEKDETRFKDVVELSRKQDVPLIAFRLHCGDDVLRNRATSEERQGKNKLTNMERIGKIKEKPLLTPSLDEAKLVDMDVTGLTPQQSAVCIHLTTQLVLRGDLAHVLPQHVANKVTEAVNKTIDGKAAFTKWPEPASLKLLEEGLASIIRQHGAGQQRSAAKGR